MTAVTPDRLRAKAPGRKVLKDGGVKPIGRPFWLLSPGVLWLLVFGLAPLAFMLMMSFWTSTIFGTKPDFSFDNYARVLVTELYRDQLFKTLRIAFTTTALTVVISYPVAYLLSRLKGMQKALFVLMMFLPFWTSYVIRAFVWLPILGRNGAINNALQSLGITDAPIDWLLFNEGAVFLGLVYVYTLFMTLPIYLSLEKIDPALVEAATDLGARPAAVFRRVILPLSWPGVLSGCIMVFLLSISAFVTPQLLGGPSGIMYGNVIASQFLANNNWAFGSALSISLVAIVLVLLLISSRWIGVQHVFTGGRNA
ncbi:MAG: ABC-type spermidine/putrescine transport system permease subunit I [Alphaproteobacteria bacterium]|jgi:ABC-type spermidine/putrescine transport system permease subunit I